MNQANFITVWARLGERKKIIPTVQGEDWRGSTSEGFIHAWNTISLDTITAEAPAI